MGATIEACPIQDPSPTARSLKFLPNPRGHRRDTPGTGIRTRGRVKHHKSRRSRHRRYQPRPDSHRHCQPIPRGSLLPPERHPGAGAAPYGSGGTISRCSCSTSSTSSAARPASKITVVARGDAAADVVCGWPGNVRQLENAVERAVAFGAAHGQIDITGSPARTSGRRGAAHDGVVGAAGERRGPLRRSSPASNKS